MIPGWFPKPKRKRKPKRGEPALWVPYARRTLFGLVAVLVIALLVRAGAFDSIRRRYYCGQGWSDYTHRRYDAAIRDYTRALDLDSGSATCYQRRGMAYAALKQWDAAEADYARAITINPDKPDYYDWRGAMYIWMGAPDKAIADYDRAIALDPEHARFYQKSAVNPPPSGVGI